jgi:hypothetical protein
VRAPFVIIGQEKSKRASQGPLIPHNDVIETLPSQSANQALHEGILPRRAGRGQDLLCAETL